MRLTVASYNIHKAVGTDGIRDPARILAVIDELEADIVALQEVDRRFGQRLAVLDRAALAQRGWQVASVPLLPGSLGWHGNALLVRRGLAICSVEPVRLPALEARGALRALVAGPGDSRLCVTAMHLDLTGLRRRGQVRALCAAARTDGLPAVMLGDCNEWSVRAGGLGALAEGWQVLTPGPSFPARRPLLALDRVIHSRHWRCSDHGVHASALARRASDHLPVRAVLDLSH